MEDIIMISGEMQGINVDGNVHQNPQILKISAIHLFKERQRSLLIMYWNCSVGLARKGKQTYK
jgi:hypothetical protein